MRKKKVLRELKWFCVSALLVILTIGSVIGVANFCQWRVDMNMVRLERKMAE